MSPSTLRVGTWNILGRQHNERPGPADDGAIGTTLAEAPVDVLCLQEVHFYDGQEDQQLRAELRMAGLEHFVGEPLSPSHLDADAQLGVCIAARFPLRDKHAHKLNNPGLRATVRGKNWHLHDKGVVGADLDLGHDRSVKVHSLHLFPFFEFGVDDTDDYAEKMWRELWAYADRASESANVILAGDYNQARRADAAKEWSDLDWTFCVPDAVTTTIGLSLDDIATNWATPSAGHRVVSNFSDHHLVIADLVL